MHSDGEFCMASSPISELKGQVDMFLPSQPAPLVAPGPEPRGGSILPLVYTDPSVV
jgi:hypothetical protein